MLEIYDTTVALTDSDDPRRIRAASEGITSMPPNNRGRSTTGRAAVPYYPRAQHIEAAKHLRLVVTRYINDRATLNDIREAMANLGAVAPVPGDKNYREPKT
jgi:hypothetical protein